MPKDPSFCKAIASCVNRLLSYILIELSLNKDLDAHLNLISKKVNLTGVPGFENIGYDDWANQCKHEFDNNLIKQISYAGFKLRVNTDTSIMFKTHETVEASDNSINAQGIEVIIEKEDDNQWRVVQERILPEEKLKHDQLLNS